MHLFNRYNYGTESKAGWRTLLRGLLLLLNMTGVPRLVVRLMLDRRVPLKSKLILPAGILYVISPIDLVPDILPALGRIDDAIAVLISLALFLGSAPKDVVWEHLRAGRENTKSERPTKRRDGSVIEGTSRIVDDEKK